MLNGYNIYYIILYYKYTPDEKEVYTYYIIYAIYK